MLKSFSTKILLSSTVFFIVKNTCVRRYDFNIVFIKDE